MTNPCKARAAGVAISLAAVGTLACAGAGGGGVKGANFPSQKEVARIATAAPPEAVFDADLRSSPEWRLEAEAPERIERRRWVQGDDWGELLREATENSGGLSVATEAMHCVLARFALTEGGHPDLSLRRFIVGGCNASVPDVAFSWLSGSIDPLADEARLFETWRDSTAGMLQKYVQPGSTAVVGLAFARTDERAVVYFVHATPEVDLEPVRTRLEPGLRFELRGRVLGPAESVYAWINRGDYQVKPCLPGGDAVLPAFHLSCEPDPGDESAWVTLVIQPPNRVLGRSALRALVWPRGGGARVYRRLQYSAARPVSDAGTFTQALVEELNGIRLRAQLLPVTLDPAQSVTATRVAPHFFAALTGTEDEGVADVVALGLLAGWEVEGTIREAGFAFGAVPQIDDLSVLLSTTLEEPTGRATLLDPEIDRLAVGPVLEHAGGDQMMAALVTGYTLFDEGRHAADAELLFARLAAERGKRELPPPQRLVKVWMDAKRAADDVGGGERPRYAMDDLLQASVDLLSQNVQGWHGETSELDDFEFPEEFLSARRLATAIGVSHRKGPEDAWGRYVVMIVAVTH